MAILYEIYSYFIGIDQIFRYKFVHLLFGINMAKRKI